MDRLEDLDSVDFMENLTKPDDIIEEVASSEWQSYEIDFKKWPFKKLENLDYKIELKITSLNSFQLKIVEPRFTEIQVIKYASKMI